MCSGTPFLALDVSQGHEFSEYFNGTSFEPVLLIAFSIIGSSVVLGADLGREAREAPQNTPQFFPSDHYVGCGRHGDEVLLRAVTLGCCRLDI